MEDLTVEYRRRTERAVATSLFERVLLGFLRYGQIPRHLGVIMDGNRRYAKSRNLPIKEGHRSGSIKLFELLKWSHLLQIEIVTVYAFSIENLKRNPEEVDDLFDLFLERIEVALARLQEDHGVEKQVMGDFQIRFCGDRTRLSKKLNDKISELEAQFTTKSKLLKKKSSGTSDKFILNICICYTSSNDIYRGIRQLAEEVKDIKALGNDELTSKSLSADFSNIIEPDMIFRTGGNYRLSEFLSFQSAFSILAFSNVTWPELSVLNLAWAILTYQLNYPYVKQAKEIYKLTPRQL